MLTDAQIEHFLATTGIASIAHGISNAQWRKIKRNAIAWRDISYPRPMKRYYAHAVLPDRCNVI